ncbi:MAG: histidine kinase [Clostridia bacterium]|nr:histidine kinase [Clostridia bacterium]
MHKKSKQPLFRFMAKRRILPAILLITALLVFFFMMMYLLIGYNSQTRQQHQAERLKQSVIEIDHELTEIVHSEYEILSSRGFSEFVYMYDDLDWYRRYELQKSLAKELIAIKSESDYVKGAWMYIPSMNKAISDQRINPLAPAWLSAYRQGDEPLQIISEEPVYFVEHTDPDDPSQLIAVAAVILDEAKIRSRLMYVQRSEQDTILLNWNAHQSPEDQQTPDLMTDGFARLSVDCDRIPLQVVYVLCEDEMDVLAQQLILLCVAFVMVMLVSEIIVFANWYRDVYDPLHRLLIDAFGHAERGDFKYRISISQASPFKPIYDRYNQMMEKTEYYVENELKQQLLISKANLKQLQAQISPHFMYNSYYILFRLIKKGDRESSLLMCEHLGQFYHYITRNADDEKRLSEEVEHTQHYAAIQKFRFREMLDVQISPPPAEIADVYVPRLILQPLLENAFKYAYQTDREDGVMTLRVHFTVYSPISFDIIVENSGSVDEQTIESIRKNLAATDDSIETTALINIHRRLQIYFSDHSALSVDRSALGGLLVRIHIDDTREDL